MAEAAEIKYVDLKEMTKDEVEIPESVWNAQLAAYYGNTPGDILSKIQSDLANSNGATGLGWLVNVKTTPYPHYFFSTVVPRMTGVSLAFCPQASMDAQTYAVWIHDAAYKLNPKAAAGGEWKASGLENFNGFIQHQWKCEKTVIDEATLEETTAMTDMNDNMLFWAMHMYHKTKPETLTALKKLKFSFAGNQYKVIKVDTMGDSDSIVSAQGNGECLCACRTATGILVANWADLSYPGEGRRKWGSLKGKNIQFFQMVKDLSNEFELLAMAGDD